MLGFGSIFLIILTIIFTLVKIGKFRRRHNGMPPGPATWPFFGNLDLLCWDNRFHVTARKLGYKYNGLFSLQHGPYPGIVITDHRIAKEAFLEKADIFTDRPDHLDWNKFIAPSKNAGISYQNGETYKRLKKITMASLRDVGVGKATTDYTLQKELVHMISYIDQREGQFFSLHHLFDMAVTNTVCAVLFGTRYDYSDPILTQLSECISFIVDQLGSRNAFEYLPWWTFVLIPFKSNIRKILRCEQFVKNWMTQQIENHKESFDKSHLGDFVDLYLNMKSTEETNNITGPFGLPHKTTKTTHLAGYIIPKHTLVSLCSYAVNLDEILWPDAMAFRPERFLDDQGKYVKPGVFTPFGIGRRTCPGESLARIELWTYVGELIRKFRFEAENTDKLPSPETTEFAVSLTPGDCRVKATKIE